MEVLPIQTSPLWFTEYTHSRIRKKRSHFVLTKEGKSSNILSMQEMPYGPDGERGNLIYMQELALRTFVHERIDLEKERRENYV